MSKTIYKSYIICTSPRSGSTLLCKLLAATGKSGNPDSHFHKPSLSSWLRSFGLQNNYYGSDREAVQAVFGAARDRGTGGSEVFGLRMQRGSFDFFMQQVSVLKPGLVSDVARLQAIFGPVLFIYLTRPNKLDQAISLVKATQTGLWHRAADGTELERLAPPQRPAYDAKEIELNMNELTDFEAAWKLWFHRENIEPLTISYDALSADPAEVLAIILDHLDLDRACANDIKPPVAKLADAINLSWALRFRREMAARKD